MKYLVTGGAGFIGSHIVDALVGLGHDVVVLDNLSSGSMENLASVFGQIEFVQGDIRDPEVCLCVAAGCDGIFHQAALVSVADSVERPRDNHEINLTGVLNVLEAARACKVARLVFASSAAVYGDNPVLPKVESMLPEPISPYALAKIGGEHYLRAYARLYGINCVALRYFNVYGQRQNPSSPYSGVISIFRKHVSEGLPVTVYGDGGQTRDFVHASDVVSANLLAMNLPQVGRIGDERFGVYNVATGEGRSLLEMLSFLEKACERKVERVFAPERSGDIRHSLSDNSQLVSRGWKPLVGLEAGLTSMFRSGFC